MAVLDIICRVVHRVELCVDKIAASTVFRILARLVSLIPVVLCVCLYSYEFYSFHVHVPAVSKTPGKHFWSPPAIAYNLFLPLAFVAYLRTAFSNPGYVDGVRSVELDAESRGAISSNAELQDYCGKCRAS